MLAIVKKDPELVAVPTFAPVSVSDKDAPLRSVPTITNATPESSAADVIVTFCATALVIDPRSANFPPSVNASPFPTS